MAIAHNGRIQLHGFKLQADLLIFLWASVWYIKKSLPLFPPLDIHTCFDTGQTMATERKKLSSEGIFLPKKAKERNVMSNSNNNQINIPQAREAMDRFKMQAAQEVGVNLTNGYNGHLTSREAGSVGGQMVKKMIEAYEQGLQ
jgi:small acid-soluble spore protein D (minor alpha/beta-type SASP)